MDKQRYLLDYGLTYSNFKERNSFPIIWIISNLIIFVLSKIDVLNDLERLLQVTQTIHQKF